VVTPPRSDAVKRHPYLSIKSDRAMEVGCWMAVGQMKSRARMHLHGEPGFGWRVFSGGWKMSNDVRSRCLTTCLVLVASEFATDCDGDGNGAG
jgi:hypothetical protein